MTDIHICETMHFDNWPSSSVVGALSIWYSEIKMSKLYIVLGARVNALIWHTVVAVMFIIQMTARHRHPPLSKTIKIIIIFRDFDAIQILNGKKWTLPLFSTAQRIVHRAHAPFCEWNTLPFGAVNAYRESRARSGTSRYANCNHLIDSMNKKKYKNRVETDEKKGSLGSRAQYRNREKKWNKTHPFTKLILALWAKWFNGAVSVVLCIVLRNETV